MSPDFDAQNVDYLWSLLPLPLILGGAGCVATLVFLVAILLRLSLLTCKALARRLCCKNCHIFRCCTCCKVGCTHPDSRCSRHCCCCLQQVRRLTMSKQPSVTSRFRTHNAVRHGIMLAYAFTLVCVVVTDAVVFLSQQQLGAALGHLSNAINLARGIFQSVIGKAANVLLRMAHIAVSIVNEPCTPYVPSAQKDAVLAAAQTLQSAAANMQAFASPICDKMLALSVFLTSTLQPIVDRVIYTFFLVLLVVVFIYAIGEHLQYRILMRIALLLSALIVLGLSSGCAVVMVLVMLLGDFCISPAKNALSLIGDKQSLLYTELEYYTSCTGTNPFSVDLTASSTSSIDLNSTITTMADQGLASSSCLTDLFDSSQAVSKDLAAIQELIACPRVNALWVEAIEVAFCTDGLGGLYDVWITFTVASALLFAAMILAYTFYTWFLEVDVIGSGWFSDETLRDDEGGDEKEYAIDEADCEGAPEDDDDQDQHLHSVDLTFSHDDIEYTVHATKL